MSRCGTQPSRGKSADAALAAAFFSAARVPLSHFENLP
jgi:hypothetical protein